MTIAYEQHLRHKLKPKEMAFVKCPKKDQHKDSYDMTTICAHQYFTRRCCSLILYG